VVLNHHQPQKKTEKDAGDEREGKGATQVVKEGEQCEQDS